MSTAKKVSVLFICLGNICRSPTADGVFRRLVEDAGLGDQIHVDSAGTGDWHVGKAPDERMQAVAMERGYDLSALKARQLQAEDLDNFDYLLVMDKQNQADVEDLVTELEQMDKIRLLLSFNPSAIKEVPDPYYGGDSGFYQVMDLVEGACKRLLVQLRKNHDL
ncbi:low molecular weight protein-tyrosine-phosphatase [Marinospirillum perlucidum]|uniref:low molecular weight protein-tyrosine-phosphatase n=1 Tax=Marinospirillum perlucidum TaxID=1982602 RepID=UPI000DF2AEB7|nr:low molecular weight protein-tyrosine-phosphatase [Marinospirillum perlucidum]